MLNIVASYHLMQFQQISLYRKFSITQTREDETHIQMIKNYIVSKCKISNPGEFIHMIR